MKIRLLALALLIAILPGPAWAAQGGKALMLTVFGTSTEASVTFDELLPLVQQRFPDRKVVVPYTSSVIRDKLNAKISDPAAKILSPAEMLEKLRSEGYEDIAVVSTILFPGVEHDKLKGAVDKFSSANRGIKVTYAPPLLSERENMQAVVKVIGKYILIDGHNIVVAHGTHDGHLVEKNYMTLAALVAQSYPNARVGSIEGLPDMQRALAWLESKPGKDARFVVFMFVAGDHAENDIASGEDDSLFTAAREMGKRPSVAWVKTSAGPRMASLGLDEDYRRILLDYYVRKIR